MIEEIDVAGDIIQISCGRAHTLLWSSNGGKNETLIIRVYCVSFTKGNIEDKWNKPGIGVALSYIFG